MSLAVGAAFPVDIAVDSSRGAVRLSDMVGAGPIVVAFHRLWCPFCQQAARELAAAKDQLDARGARVVIVYREHVDLVRSSCNQRGIPFDCLSDSHRELENAAEVEPFSIGRYAAFSPRRLVDALRSGSQIAKATSGLLQGRSTFVVDKSGRIVYAHRSVNAADIPPIGEVISAVRAVADTRLSPNFGKTRLDEGRRTVSWHQVRQARRGELPTVLDLAKAFYAEEGFTTPISQLRDNLAVLLDSDSARVAVAVGPDDEIVGFSITTLSFGLEEGCIAELEDLFVRPTHRRSGIAGALIDDSAEWARSHRCRALELVVAPSGNDVAHLFGYYARRGFIDEGRRLLSRNLAPGLGSQRVGVGDR